MPNLSEIHAVLGTPLYRIDNGALHAARWRLRDVENTTIGDGSIRMMMPLSDRQRVRHETKSGTVQHDIRVGSLVVIDPMQDVRAIVEGEFDVLAVSLSGWAAPERFTHDSIHSLDRQRSRAIAVRRILLLMRNPGADALAELDQHALSLRDSFAAPTTSDDLLRGGMTAARLRRVKDFVEAALDCPGNAVPSLSEMAEAAGLSLYHFAREFRRTMGVTPYVFALDRRLRRVETLLVHSNLSIERIALRYGFASGAHLIRRFHGHMGVTPARYREAVTDQRIQIPVRWRHIRDY